MKPLTPPWVVPFWISNAELPLADEVQPVTLLTADHDELMELLSKLPLTTSSVAALATPADSRVAAAATFKKMADNFMVVPFIGLEIILFPE
jgi:hypothetical protein